MNCIALILKSGQISERQWQTRRLPCSPLPTDTPRQHYIYAANSEKKDGHYQKRHSTGSLERKPQSHIKMSKRGRDAFGNKTPCVTKHKQERHHNYREVRDSDPKQGIVGAGETQ